MFLEQAQQDAVFFLVDMERFVLRNGSDVNCRSETKATKRSEFCMQGITLCDSAIFSLVTKNAHYKSVLYLWWTWRDLNSRPLIPNLPFYIISFFVDTFVIHLETNPLTNGIKKVVTSFVFMLTKNALLSN